MNLNFVAGLLLDHFTPPLVAVAVIADVLAGLEVISVDAIMFGGKLVSVPVIVDA